MWTQGEINMKKMAFAKKKESKKVLEEDSWKVLIIDDEEEVHQITRGVLSKFEYENRAIECISAFSADEAIVKLQENTDIALVLLDVVMETEDAGLVTVKRIREELNNKLVRIILRTGQPGSAPEQEVIRDYDINDYKEKTELTAAKLYTVVIASLRAYRDISVIEQNRLGLKAIIESSSDIFKLQSFKNFAQGVLVQLLALVEHDSQTTKKNAFSIVKGEHGYELLAASGVFENQSVDEVLSEEVTALLEEAMLKKSHVNKGKNHLYFFETNNATTSIFYFLGDRNIGDMNRALIDIFSVNVSIAFENLNLNQEIFDTQKELIEKLGEVIETRSNETAHHVKRVAQVSYILAKAYGLDEQTAKLIKLASPMHDIGKVGIKDNILLKPGRLDHQEFEVMKTHARLGSDILSGSSRELLQTASIIAKEHHERWDGKGYPDGKAGEDIHIYGRITMVADIFDALVHKRCYKEAWSLERAQKFLHDESGKMFDPRLIELFFENIEEINEICGTLESNSEYV